MNIFHRNRSDTSNAIEQKESVEINIAIDGQSYVTGMGVSVDDLTAKINAHLERLQAFYDQRAARPADQQKSFNLEKLNRSIQSARDDNLRKIYDRSFLNIAEAYESWAIIDNTPQDGKSAWDFAWSVLNRDMLGAVFAVSNGQKDRMSTGYVELIYARGMHCLREMKYTADKNTRRYYAELAAGLFYTYLLETRKLNMTSHWRVNDAIKNIHIAAKVGGLKTDQLKNVVDKVLAKPNEQDSAGFMKQVTADVDAYSLPEKDPTRLKQLIY